MRFRLAAILVALVARRSSARRLRSPAGGRPGCTRSCSSRTSRRRRRSTARRRSRGTRCRARSSYQFQLSTEQHVPRQLHRLQHEQPHDARRRAAAEAPVDHRPAARALRARPRDAHRRQRHRLERLLRLRRARRRRRRRRCRAIRASCAGRPSTARPATRSGSIDVPGKDRASARRCRRTRTFSTSASSTPSTRQPNWIGTVRWRDPRACARRTLARPVERPFPRDLVRAVELRSTASTNPAVTGGPITLRHTISDVISNGGVATTATQAHARDSRGPATRRSAARPSSSTASTCSPTRPCLNPVYVEPRRRQPGVRTAAERRRSRSRRTPAAIGLARGGYLPTGSEPLGEMLRRHPADAPGTRCRRRPRPRPRRPTSIPAVSRRPDARSPVAPPPHRTERRRAAARQAAARPSHRLRPAPRSTCGTPTRPEERLLLDRRPGVGAIPSAASASTVAAPGASKGSTLVPVADVTKFSVGESITIGTAPLSDTATITRDRQRPAHAQHAAQQRARRRRAGVEHGVERRHLPRPRAAAGRVHAAGSVTSESRARPRSRRASTTFATGLSPTGRLLLRRADAVVLRARR